MAQIVLRASDVAFALWTLAQEYPDEPKFDTPEIREFIKALDEDDQGMVMLKDEEDGAYCDICDY